MILQVTTFSPQICRGFTATTLCPKSPNGDAEIDAQLGGSRHGHLVHLFLNKECNVQDTVILWVVEDIIWDLRWYLSFGEWGLFLLTNKNLESVRNIFLGGFVMMKHLFREILCWNCFHRFPTLENVYWTWFGCTNGYPIYSAYIIQWEILYLEDHPSTCTWSGSPPFISHLAHLEGVVNHSLAGTILQVPLSFVSQSGWPMVHVMFGFCSWCSNEQWPKSAPIFYIAQILVFNSSKGSLLLLFMVQKSGKLSSWYGNYPMIYKVLVPSQVGKLAGFLNHQQYRYK